MSVPDRAFEKKTVRIKTDFLNAKLSATVAESQKTNYRDKDCRLLKNFFFLNKRDPWI